MSSAGNAAAAFGVACAVVATGGCQAYRAQPLEADAARAAWSGRLDGSEGALEFSRRLASVGVDGAGFDLTDGLSVGEGELVALVFNPGLREARAGAGVLRARAEFAGLWDDPVLGLDVERILGGVDDPWVVGGTVGLTLPVSGRLAVERARARAEHEAELRRVAAAEWGVRVEVRRAWATWTAARRRVALASELDGRLAGVIAVVEAKQRAGVLSRSEARLFTIERAMRVVEWRRAEADERDAELRLRGLLGLRGGAPVRLVESAIGGEPSTAMGERGVDGVATEGDVDELVAGNVLISARRSEYVVAEESLRLAIREQYPDVEIGPGLGSEEGRGRVLLGVSVPLAVWNGGRGRIAEAHAARDLAREAFASELERQVSALEVSLAALRGSREARGALERDVVPLVEEQEAEARRLADLAEVDALLLLESLTRLSDVKALLLESRLDEALALVDVEGLFGPGASRAEVAP